MTYEEYEVLAPGAFLQSSPTDYWIKPEQRQDFHLEGMLINLINGKVMHFSRLENLVEILPHEIMW